MVVSDQPDGATREVVVQLQALGAYTETWPLNCPKSDKIVTQFADYLTKEEANKGFAEIGMLFPPTEAGEHYWIDLIGLRVVTTEGCELGAVSHLMETGANDVLVVQGDRERLIPYLPGQVVMEVRTQDRCIVVDWDPEF